MDLNPCEKYHRVLQVIILDPTQEHAAELLSVAEMFYANNIPLRLVFVSSGMWGTVNSPEPIRRLEMDILVAFKIFSLHI